VVVVGFGKRVSWCCLRGEVGAFVAVVVGDSFWRLSMLLGSIFVVATSCLGFGLLRCLRWFLRMCVLRAELLFIFYWRLHHRSLTFCELDSGGPVTFASRSGVGV